MLNDRECKNAKRQEKPYKLPDGNGLYLEVKPNGVKAWRYRFELRQDGVAHHLFDSLDEIQDFATRWLWTYNHERPHMALGGITPIQKLALAA